MRGAESPAFDRRAWLERLPSSLASRTKVREPEAHPAVFRTSTVSVATGDEVGIGAQVVVHTAECGVDRRRRQELAGKADARARCPERKEPPSRENGQLLRAHGGAALKLVANKIVDRREIRGENTENAGICHECMTLMLGERTAGFLAEKGQSWGRNQVPGLTPSVIRPECQRCAAATGTKWRIMTT
jgi:hypothetical protein